MNCIRKIISSECSFSQFWNVSKFIEICWKCIGRIIWSNAVLLEMCFDRNCTLSVDNRMSDWGNFCRRTKIDSPAFSISLIHFFKTGEEDRCDKDEILRLPRPPIIPLGRRFSPALDWWHHQPPTQALIPTQPLHPLSLNPTPSSPSSVTANSSQSIAHPLDLPQSSLTTNTVFAEYSVHIFLML